MVFIVGVGLLQLKTVRAMKQLGMIQAVIQLVDVAMDVRK